MKTSGAWRAIDFLAGAVVHGLLLLFLVRRIGWLPWLGLAGGAGLLCACSDRLRARLGRRVARAAGVVYGALVGGAAVFSWIHVCFFNPWLCILIGLFTLWTVVMLVAGLEPLAGVWLAVGLAVAGFAVADARLATTPFAIVLLAAGLAILLTCVFAGRLRTVGRGFVALFCLAAAAAAANDVFAHGVDFSGGSVKAPGVHPIVTWTPGSHAWKSQLGLNLHFAGVDSFNRLLIGAANGIFLFDPAMIAQLPVGPGGGDVAADFANHRLFAATRDGVLDRIDGKDLPVVLQQGLPGGGRRVRLAPEGVYVLAGRRWLGLYEPETLKLRRQWSDESFADILPDGEGGFFAATRRGRLLRYPPDGARPISVSVGFWPGGCSLAYDRAGGRLFVAVARSRALRVYAAEGLRLLRTVKIGWGARELVWSEKHAALFVGRYFAGEVLALAGDDLREVGRVALGPRLTSLALDEKEKYVLAADAAGVFSLDIAAAFPLPQQ